MKKTFLLIAIAAASTTTVKAQTTYTSTVDDKNVTIYKGIVTKYDIQKDHAFDGWYPGNQKAYSPEPAVLAAMQEAKGKLQFVVFGGTWCEDTQFILPKFFKLQELGGVPDSTVSFFAVDRSKKTLGNIADAFKITNVPTIIVMKDGKEINRLVEYGKTGKWDTELAEMLKPTPPMQPARKAEINEDKPVKF